MGKFICVNSECSKHLIEFVNCVSGHCPRCGTYGASVADIRARNLEHQSRLTVLKEKIEKFTSTLEKHHLISMFCLEEGDQWEEEMGEDTLCYFCADCSVLLPFDQIKLHMDDTVCRKCEATYA